MATTIGLEQAQRNLEVYAQGLRSGALLAGHEIAVLLEGYAKSHHPWSPKTGATDVSTKGTVAEVSTEMIRIVLSAGMDYDVFLEFAKEGKWAWLWPAVVANKEVIRGILKKRLTGVRVG
jgi:hypothetical protein